MIRSTLAIRATSTMASSEVGSRLQGCRWLLVTLRMGRRTRNWRWWTRTETWSWCRSTSYLGRKRAGPLPSSPKFSHFRSVSGVDGIRDRDAGVTGGDLGSRRDANVRIVRRIRGGISRFQTPVVGSRSETGSCLEGGSRGSDRGRTSFGVVEASRVGKVDRIVAQPDQLISVLRQPSLGSVRVFPTLPEIFCPSPSSLRGSCGRNGCVSTNVR